MLQTASKLAMYLESKIYSLDKSCYLILFVTIYDATYWLETWHLMYCEKVVLS